jgi:hypothetical protein
MVRYSRPSSLRERAGHRHEAPEAPSPHPALILLLLLKSPADEKRAAARQGDDLVPVADVEDLRPV